MIIERLKSLAAIAAFLGLASGTARADVCTALQLKALAKFESSLLLCQSKASLKGDAFALGDCRDKAASKFTVVFGKAGTCSGLAVVCESTADECEEAVVAAVSDAAPSKCAAAKRKAAAKLVAARLACYATAAKAGVAADAGCLSKADSAFDTAITKAGACADGGNLRALVDSTCVLPAPTLDGAQLVTGACLDVDECLAVTDDCDTNATCTNTPGGFTCTCNAGYSGDGATCTEIDECSAGTDNCDANAECTNTTGSFSCTCLPGYIGDGVTCTATDECSAGTDNCDANAECTDTPDSFTCTCLAGFTGDGVTCTDIDECTEATDNCDANAACNNTPGGFSCTCNAGYGGDGVTCDLLLSCPCWDDQTASSLVAALELGAGLPVKICSFGPSPEQVQITAKTNPYNVNQVASIYTTNFPNPENGCCAYIQGSTPGCVPYISNEVVTQCKNEMIAVAPLVSWCPH